MLNLPRSGLPHPSGLRPATLPTAHGCAVLGGGKEERVALFCDLLLVKREVFSLPGAKRMGRVARLRAFSEHLDGWGASAKRGRRGECICKAAAQEPDAAGSEAVGKAARAQAARVSFQTASADPAYHRGLRVVPREACDRGRWRTA